jgi:aconitase A
VDVARAGGVLKEAMQLSDQARQPSGRPAVGETTYDVHRLAEADYFRHGGILPYVLRQLVAS